MPKDRNRNDDDHEPELRQNECQSCGDPLGRNSDGSSRCTMCAATQGQLFEPNGRKRRFIINSDEL
jgi:hypothetical protein